MCEPHSIIYGRKALIEPYKSVTLLTGTYVEIRDKRGLMKKRYFTFFYCSDTEMLRQRAILITAAFLWL